MKEQQIITQIKISLLLLIFSISLICTDKKFTDNINIFELIQKLNFVTPIIENIIDFLNPKI